MFNASHFSLIIDITSEQKQITSEHVWEKLVDWPAQSQWMLQTKVWTAESTDARNYVNTNGPGTTIFAFTGLAAHKYPRGWFGIKIGVLDKMIVTTWQPPTFCEVEHVGNIIKGLGVFRLETIPAGVRFHWFEEIRGPKWILFTLRPAILAGAYFSLRRFRASLL